MDKEPGGQLAQPTVSEKENWGRDMTEALSLLKERKT